MVSTSKVPLRGTASRDTSSRGVRRSSPITFRGSIRGAGSRTTTQTMPPHFSAPSPSQFFALDPVSGANG